MARFDIVFQNSAIIQVTWDICQLNLLLLEPESEHIIIYDIPINTIEQQYILQVSLYFADILDHLAESLRIRWIFLLKMKCNSIETTLIIVCLILHSIYPYP